MAPQICILDAFTTNPGDLDFSALADLGALTVHDRTSPSECVARAVDADIVLTNKVLLDARTLDQLPRLRLVCLMSTGTNAVDLQACAARGIPVCNVPAYSTASVAELVFAYLMEWSRHPGAWNSSVQAGDWAAGPDFSYHLLPQIEWAGKTLGVVGFGDIGQSVARIGVALNMRVLVVTPNPRGKPDLGQEFVDLDTLFTESDVISLHCPLQPETRHLIHEDRLAQMKASSLLINTGRGGLVDEDALSKALREKRIGGAMLDVLSAEPPPPDHPLIGLPNCLVTPHIGWSTREARQRLVACLVGNVLAYLQGCPRNVVNGV